LIWGTALGFYQSNSPNPDDTGAHDLSGCRNGWCAECERVRVKCGGWTDESETFAGITLACEHCFEEFRSRNTTGDEVP
jgi:hypothetical protein